MLFRTASTTEAQELHLLKPSFSQEKGTDKPFSHTTCVVRSLFAVNRTILPQIVRKCVHVYARILFLPNAHIITHSFVGRKRPARQFSTTSESTILYQNRMLPRNRHLQVRPCIVIFNRLCTSYIKTLLNSQLNPNYFNTSGLCYFRTQC